MYPAFSSILFLAFTVTLYFPLSIVPSFNNPACGTPDTFTSLVFPFPSVTLNPAVCSSTI